MGVKLPPKAFTFKQNNDFIITGMVPNLEAFIAQDMEAQKAIIDSTKDIEVNKKANKLHADLKAIDDLITSRKYSEAMQEYLTLEGANFSSSLVGSLQSLDTRFPGSVSRNPLLTDMFKTTYGQLVGDIKDDEAAAAGTIKTAGTQAPIVTTEVKQPPKNATVTDTGVIKFETVADRDAAVEAGTIPLNSDVQVGDGPIVPFTPPPSYEPVDTSKPITFSTNIEDARALASELLDQGIEAYPVIKKDDDKDTVLLQIGAYETKEDAEAAYKKLKTTVNAAALASPFMAYPDDYEPIYEAAESEGKKFVRLRLQVPNKKPTDLGDMTGAPGFRERDDFSPKPELSVEERVQAKRDAAQGVIDAVDSNVSSFTQRLDQGFASGAMTTNAYGNTILGGVAQTVGANDLADFFYTQAVKSEDGAETTEGLIPAINSLLDEFGVPDYSETDDPQVALDKAVEFVLSALPQDEKYDAALDRAPDHIEKLGDQATDAWRKLTEAVKDFSLSDVSLTTADEDNPMLKIVQAVAPVTEVETDEPEETMEDRIRDDARQFLQDRKSFPQPLPRIVIDTLTDDIVEEAKVNKEVARVVQQLDQKGGVPSRETIEDLKTTLELNQVIDTETQELYRGPISGKTLVEKLDDLVNPVIDFVRDKNAEAFRKAEARRGRGILERDSVNVEDSPSLSFLAAENEPSAMTRSRAPLGDTRTEPDATVPSISAVDRGDRPSGLMSPDKDTRKLNVGDLATFADPQLMNNIETAHGSGSKTFKDFEKKISSGTMKPADITRLIKATRKLPKTTSRGKLLDSLFDLRDSLNKR